PTRRSSDLGRRSFGRTRSRARVGPAPASSCCTSSSARPSAPAAATGSVAGGVAGRVCRGRGPRLLPPPASGPLPFLDTALAAVVELVVHLGFSLGAGEHPPQRV